MSRTFELPARYRLVRRLGEGGMGVVYDVEDRQRDVRVALKTLREMEGEALYRFKREFRALTRISHPNLVALHELFSEKGQWFYTMELISGSDFLGYVRPNPREGADKTVKIRARPREDSEPIPDTEILDTVISDRIPDDSGRPVFSAHLVTPAPMLPPLSEGRLRGALLQLVAGVHALHGSGRLHRDLKPTNVLVEPSGRVVILDFGLVAEFEHGREHQSVLNHIVGTAAYMAPEQGMGKPISQAADWYSVGVMIFEALTGERPFVGAPMDILTRKQTETPPAPKDLDPDVPEDLNRLVVRLLDKSPKARPGGEELLRHLGGADARSGMLILRPLERGTLVGREKELNVLQDALQRVRKRNAVRVDIFGASGMGKTALVSHFVDGLVHLVDAVALRGGCFEREDVPYKAFDALIDALSRFLRTLVGADLQAVLPQDILPLAHLFPVLKQLRVVRDAFSETRNLRVSDLTPEPLEQRRRAFSALRELLYNLGRRLPIILVIDDAQWGDADSAQLLHELLAPPKPPPVLVLLCYRGDDRAQSPFLKALDEVEARLGGALATGEHAVPIELGPLGEKDAQTIAGALLKDVNDAERLIARTVKEAAGNPYLLAQYAEALRSRNEITQDASQEPASAQSFSVSLDDVLFEQVSSMPPEARLLLELVMVAGRPVPKSVVFMAAKLEERKEELLAVPRSAKLVRTLPSLSLKREEELLAAYHARIRTAVLERLDAAQISAHHRALAGALETLGVKDDEALAMHLTYAGEPARAAPYAASAAKRAEDALAFVRAATLYRLALGDPTLTPLQRAGRMERLADCLASAGYGTEAAGRYLEATRLTPAAPIELRHKAAAQLLRSGHVDRGTQVLDEVLRTLDYSLVEGPRRRLVYLARSRIAVRLRGLNFKRRSETEVEPALLRRVDTLWSVSTGLGMVDTTLASDFQSRGLLLALQAGEPKRLAKALCLEACFSAAQGTSSRARTTTLLERARELAEELGDHHALGLYKMASGITSFLEGRFALGLSASAEAEGIFRGRCQGVAWEIATAQIFQVMSLAWLGQIKRLSGFIRQNLREALSRGDRYAAANLRSGLANLMWLAVDDVAGAKAVLDETRGHLPQGSFSLPHAYELLARLNLELYQGRGVNAHKQLRSIQTQLERSLALKVQYMRIEMLFLHARVALSVSKQRGALVSAESDATKLQEEKAAYAHALAVFVLAQVAEARGDEAQAIAKYKQSAIMFEREDIGLYTAIARWRCSRLQGDQSRGDQGLFEQGLHEPERFAAMIAPIAPAPVRTS